MHKALLCYTDFLLYCRGTKNDLLHYWRINSGDGNKYFCNLIKKRVTSYDAAIKEANARSQFNDCKLISYIFYPPVIAVTVREKDEQKLQSLFGFYVESDDITGIEAYYYHTAPHETPKLHAKQLSRPLQLSIQPMESDTQKSQSCILM